MESISNLNNVLSKFELTEEHIEQTNSLCVLDNEHKFMEFRDGDNIYVSGKIFDLLLWENLHDPSAKEESITIFKEQFESVDVENYNVQMGEDRLVFTSEDLATITVISMVEPD